MDDSILLERSKKTIPTTNIYPNHYTHTNNNNMKPL